MRHVPTGPGAGPMGGMDHPLAAWRLRGPGARRSGSDLARAIDAYLRRGRDARGAGGRDAGEIGADDA